MRYVFLLLAISLSLAASSKSEFAIYVVKGTPNDTAAHRSGPDLANAVVEDPPLLTQDDIVVYDWATHSITLTLTGEKKLFEYKGPDSERSGGSALRTREFIVTVDGERCYGGAFWWSISSVSYMHPVIKVSARRAQTIQIDRFYGPPSAQPSSADPRLDPRVEKALRAAGKIKDAPTATPKPNQAMQRTAARYDV
jgi:hypothetical protein